MRLFKQVSQHFLFTILLALLTTSILAANHLYLVNHYHKPLQFILGFTPEMLPDLPGNFTLQQGAQISSQVVDMAGKEAYLRAEDDSDNSTFFGVEVVDNKTIIHGYIAKNIAFSWSDETVTFCTPEDYQKNQHC